MRIEEEIINLCLSSLECGRLAGTQSLVYFDKSLLGIYGSILFESSLDSLVIAEKVSALIKVVM